MALTVILDHFHSTFMNRLWALMRFWGFQGSWMQNLPVWAAAGMWRLGPVGPVLHRHISLLKSSFLDFHNPRGHCVHGFIYEFVLFKKISHAKKPLLYKKERHHSWVSLILAIQKLELSSDSDTNLLNAPWVSHGPAFIISKKRELSYNLTPGGAGQGTADGSLRVQFVIHEDCLHKWHSKRQYNLWFKREAQKSSSRTLMCDSVAQREWSKVWSKML